MSASVTHAIRIGSDERMRRRYISATQRFLAENENLDGGVFLSAVIVNALEIAYQLSTIMGIPHDGRTKEQTFVEIATMMAKSVAAREHIIEGAEEGPQIFQRRPS